LIGREEVAERTMAFRFARPDGFRFTAGQFMEVTLQSPKETDAGGNTRPFSITSPPYEEALTVATRIRDSAFKRTLASMPTGTPVTLAGSFGDLVLHEDSTRPAVILTGGIGITPFRSIVLDAARRGLRHQITLFYSNRRPEDAAFLDELRALGSTHPAFRLIATMTQMDKSQRPWHGETGPIDWAMLVRHSAAMRTAIYYVAGPPRMVRGVQAMLDEAGVSKQNVRAEEFDGY
jgi:ferredoxin-NADP reductase